MIAADLMPLASVAQAAEVSRVKKTTKKKSAKKQPSTPRVTLPKPLPPRADAVSIFGEPTVTVERMVSFVQQHNPEFDPAIAEAFHRVGLRYGIRGDIALCQSVIETGWFRFGDGTAVTPDQYNYCGLGVTQRGVRGAVFDNIEQGVTAQMQHLYAYACDKPLPEGESAVDPRFDMVPRGSAPGWEDLNLRWAMNAQYGECIIALYKVMNDSATTVQNVGIELPEDFLIDD